jgi:hypothetical protein
MLCLCKAFFTRNEIHNLDSAKLKYEIFLRDFPKHPIAKDVAITLSNLGKSPEQMMKEFEERQQTDSLAKAQK